MGEPASLRKLSRSIGMTSGAIGLPQKLLRDLQLRFAVDKDGDGVPEQYLSAGSVADFATVRALELSVLATSVDAVTDEGDGILRQRFSQLVALRNRAP